MIKNCKKLISATLFSLLWISFAMSADALPEVMIGQTQVYLSPTETYYGGMTGNESVFNYTRSGKSPLIANLKPSISLNGTSQYVDAGSGPIISGTNDFAESIWFKRGGSTVIDQYIIGQMSKDATNATHSSAKLKLDTTDHIQFNLWGASSCSAASPGVLVTVTSTSTIASTDTSWHHLVAQRRNDTGGSFVELYLDGTNVSNSTLPTSNMVCLKNDNDIQHAIGFGANPILVSTDNNHYYFKGLLDDARIYNRSLSQAEIKSLAYGKDISDFQIKGHWNFDGNFNDSSGNGNNATNNGSTFNTSDGPITYDPTDDENFGFDQQRLIQCVNGIILNQSATKCFIKNISISSISMGIMNSRTYINNNPVLELAVLNYPDFSVIGDVYSTNMNNFAFWGRNLHQSSGTAGSDASWKMSNYTLNPEAQATWGSPEFNKNNSKIATLKGEAPILNTSLVGAGGYWYMQGNSTSGLIDNKNSDAAKYPEGKVWRISGSGNLTINSSVTFKGVGTIIVDGNLTINSADINPDPVGTNRLGFIVMGNVTINGNSKIQASIYCPNNLSVIDTGSGNNVTLTGSFVANNFNINSTNVRFYYDYALDSSWPPGFRYLSMPHPSETKQ